MQVLTCMLQLSSLLCPELEVWCKGETCLFTPHQTKKKSPPWSCSDDKPDDGKLVPIESLHNKAFVRKENGHSKCCGPLCKSSNLAFAATVPAGVGIIGAFAAAGPAGVGILDPLAEREQTER